MARAETSVEVLRSIQAGDIHAVRQLAAWRGPFALTALHLAAACGSTETISTLAAAGRQRVNVYAEGERGRGSLTAAEQQLAT